MKGEKGREIEGGIESGLGGEDLNWAEDNEKDQWVLMSIKGQSLGVETLEGQYWKDRRMGYLKLGL